MAGPEGHADARIVALSAVRNEAPYLLEWIAWHRILGVEEIVIASNDCEDGTERLLDALAAAAEVTHLARGACLPAADKVGARTKGVQWQGLRLLWRQPARKRADWVLISDVDEFPVIHAGGGRFADLFAALPGGGADTDAIALPWRLFGSAGARTIEDTPVTARFLRSAPAGLIHPICATFFKTLFRPRAFAKPGVHRPKRREGAAVPLWRDGSGQALAPLYAENDARLSLLGIADPRRLVELHHYSLRSAEAFLVKALRGLPNRTGKAIDLSYWVERNYNSVGNTAALALQPALQAEIARLMALPDVGRLHREGLAWHRATAARALQGRAGYGLYCDILHAADSAVLPEAEARRLLVLFGALREG